MDDNKKFYWIKLKTDFFEMPEIDWLQEQENGCEYIVLYQKLCLLAANTGGELIRKVGEMIIPYDVKKIAEITKFSFDTVVIALELYKKIGLILESDNKILSIANHTEMVGSETKWAEKKRIQRTKNKDKNVDNNKDIGMDNVLPLSPKCPPTLSDKRLETRDKSKEKDIEYKEKQEKEKCGVVIVDDNQQKAVHYYDSNIHPISGEIESGRIAECIKQYGAALFIKAIEVAVGRNKRTLNYVEGILRNWQVNGYDTRGKPQEPKHHYDIPF